MDSLTHIVVGAVLGDAIVDKEFGKRAMFLGAIAQSAPDIDFLASFWMDPISNLLAHRGFTHSILFCLMATPVLALIAERVHRPHNISFMKWCGFFGILIFGHIFLDAFNNYGVGWYEPFNHYRVSFNTVFVADPLFSIWPTISFVAILILPRKSHRRKFWIVIGLGLTAVYLLYCVSNKTKINYEVSTSLKEQKIPYRRYFTTPIAFNNFLWYVVADVKDGFYIGYRSVFDSKSKIDFEYFPKNDNLLEKMDEDENLQKLIRFSQGYYTAEKWHDTLVFNDLRFGQIAGWYNPRERFAFHYFIEYPDANDLVVQRGRLAKWNRETFTALINRIKGN